MSKLQPLSAAQDHSRLSSLQGTKLGGWQLERFILTDALGTVYRVSSDQGQRGQQYALRLLPASVLHAADASLTSALWADLEALSRIQSPGIVPVLEAGPTLGGQPTPYVLQPWVEGKTLRASIDSRGGRLSATEAVPLARLILGALSDLSAANLVHGCLRPSRIFIERGDDGPRRIRLCDAGLARIFEIYAQALGAGLLEGCAAEVASHADYLCPQQAHAGRTTPQTDIYSVGTILYECLSGSPPFPSATPGTTLRRQMAETPLSLLLLENAPVLPDGVQDILEIALNKLPDDRLQSPLAFRNALASLLDPSDQETQGHVPDDVLPPLPTSINDLPEPEPTPEPAATFTNGTHGTNGANHHDAPEYQAYPDPPAAESSPPSPAPVESAPPSPAPVEAAPTEPAPIEPAAPPPAATLPPVEAAPPAPPAAPAPALESSPSDIDPSELVPSTPPPAPPKAAAAPTPTKDQPANIDLDDDIDGDWFGSKTGEARVSYMALGAVGDEEAHRSQRRTTWIIALVLILSVGGLVYWILTLQPEDPEAARKAAEAAAEEEEKNRKIAAAKPIIADLEAKIAAKTFTGDQQSADMIVRQLSQYVPVALTSAQYTKYLETIAENLSALAKTAEAPYASPQTFVRHEPLKAVHKGMLEFSNAIAQQLAPDAAPNQRAFALAVNGLLSSQWTGIQMGSVFNYYTPKTHKLNLEATATAIRYWTALAGLPSLPSGPANEQLKRLRAQEAELDKEPVLVVPRWRFVGLPQPAPPEEAPPPDPAPAPTPP